MREARARQAGQGRLRPGHVHQRVGPPDRRCSSSATQRGDDQAGDAARATRRTSSRAGGGTPSARPSKLREQAARARRRRVRPRHAAARAAVRDHVDPALNDPDFVSQLVFDAGQATAGHARRRASPTCSRRRRGADPGAAAGRAERGASATPRSARSATAVAMPDWKLRARRASTSSPARRSSSRDLTDEISNSIAAAARRCAARDGADARGRLPRAPAAAAARRRARRDRADLRALSLLGASLTMASIAVLPVLIGLAVDYAIQLQSRVEERAGQAAAAVRSRAGRRPCRSPPRRRRPASSCSRSRRCRWCAGFGLLLVAGIALALALRADARARRAALGVSGAARRRRACGWRAPALRGAGDLSRLRARAAAAPGAGGRACARARCAPAVGAGPSRVLAIGLALAVVGWGLDTQTGVESDIQQARAAATCPRCATSRTCRSPPASAVRSTSSCAPTS